MLIHVSDLSQVYRSRGGEQVQALAQVDFDVARGEFVTVVGPSGCGKTTLLKVLAGILPRSAGVVELNGTPVAGPRRDVGVVFQDPLLLPWLRVLDNVLIPARVQSLPRAASRARAEHLLDLAGLKDVKTRYPFELSGGMQQRVALCRALVHDPTILLMDEPFGALDALTREHLNLELLRLWSQSQKTVVFVTHSIPEAVFLGDRVIVLTPRPGHVQEVVPVALPRPRTLDTMETERFAALTGRLRRAFTWPEGFDG